MHVLPAPFFGRRAFSQWSFWLLLVAFASPFQVFALDPEKSLSQYRIERWTRQNGLPGDRVNTVTQTRDGYLWVGTQFGLARYNGLSFEVVPISLVDTPTQDVRVLAAGAQGELWITINHAEFAGYRDGAFFEVGNEHGRALGMTGKTIFEDRSGAVWTGSNHGYGKWDRVDPAASFHRDQAPRVFTFFEDPELDRMWIGTEENGLFYHDAEGLHTFGDSSLRDLIINALALDGFGRLWVGTNRGLRCYDAVTGEVLPILPFVNGVNALLVDRHGQLWVGSEDFGLLRWEEGGYQTLGLAQGLGSERVTALAEDAEGSIWVGTHDGLVQLSDMKFPLIVASEATYSGTPHTVSPAGEGGVWVASSHGVTRLLRGLAVESFGPETLPNNYAKLAFERRDGDLLVVDGDRYINILRHGQLVGRVREPGWPEVIVEDDESVIVAIREKLFRLHGERLTPFVFNGPAPDFGYFDNLLVSCDGALWAASYHGVFRLQDGESEQWAMFNGLATDRVHCLVEEPDGTIWAGLPVGLARIRDGEVRNLSRRDGLYDDEIFAMAADDKGELWIDSRQGIYRVPFTELNAVAEGHLTEVRCSTFEGEREVRFLDRVGHEYSASKTEDGRIWFPTGRGIVVIDPSNYFVNRVPPPVHLAFWRINGERQPWSAKSDLPKGNAQIEFQFDVLSFLAPRQLQVRYLLEGYDRGWVEAGDRRTASYQLSPGEYHFRVQAANTDGIWNEVGADFAFVLPPPFYATLWFALFASAGGLGLLYGAYHLQLQRVRAQQQRLREINDLLEAKVRQRTTELAHSLSLLQATIDSTEDGILAVDREGTIVSANARFCALFGFAMDDLRLSRDEDVLALIASLAEDSDAYLTRARALRENPAEEAFDVIPLKDGRTFERYTKPQRRNGEVVGFVVNLRDVTARKAVAAELAAAQARLLETSREIGMAEVATSVLHNVGNVLNSVNVSATLISDLVANAKVSQVRRLSDLLAAHLADLGDFLTENPQGKNVPAFLAALAQRLEFEQSKVLAEITSLQNNIEHIKGIVVMQQSYAKVSGIKETVHASECVREALRLSEIATRAPAIEVHPDFVDDPVFAVEKHKVLQILVNLIRNASHACLDSTNPRKVVAIRVRSEADSVHFVVADTGVGIDAALRGKIFQHGFTTRARGHGFGLHSGALAAKSMNGSLTVESAGIGQGATFTLSLPIEPREAANFS